MDRYETGSGNLVYCLPVTAFPGMEVNVYVVIAGEYQVLIDSGSGYGPANEQIQEGMAQISRDLGRKFGPGELTHILISHAHIDHFGGLVFILQNSEARLGVHMLDRRILANYEETLALAARKLDCYFREAGINRERRSELLELYRINKALFHSVPVDFNLANGTKNLGPFEALHVPGHTAGHVMIRLDDCIFSGDHILQDISPHQAPEQITLGTGLTHYLNSLQLALGWVQEARYVFPGHKQPLLDPAAVVSRIMDVHRERLARVLSLCKQPKNIAEISQELFNHVHGYHELLALEETGAHVEYLYQHGWLHIENLSELEAEDRIVPIYYRTSADIEDLDRLSFQIPGYLSRR